MQFAVTDLDVLAQECDALGLELVRGATNYKWYGRWLDDWQDTSRAAALRGHDPSTFGTCVHKIRRKDGTGYEVGLVPRIDGGEGWDAIYDAYGSEGRRLEQAAGQGLSTLRHNVQAAVALKTAQRTLGRQGFRCWRETDDKGFTRVKALKV